MVQPNAFDVSSGQTRTFIICGKEINGTASSRSHETWEEQKFRMDKMLAKLKQEMQEVKSMDKNLTRQFIQLGGQIKKLKTTENQLFLQLQEECDVDSEDDDEDIDLQNTKL